MPQEKNQMSNRVDNIFTGRSKKSIIQSSKTDPHSIHLIHLVPFAILRVVVLTSHCPSWQALRFGFIPFIHPCFCLHHAWITAEWFQHSHHTRMIIFFLDHLDSVRTCERGMPSTDIFLTNRQRRKLCGKPPKSSILN